MTGLDADDPPFSVGKLPKASENFRRPSQIFPKMFHLLPILSKYFTGKHHLIKALPPNCRRTGRKFLRDATRRGPRPIINISASAFLRSASLKAARGRSPAPKSERARAERTRTFSVAAFRTYREHNLEPLSRDCFCARLRSSGARTFWSSVRQLDLANSSSRMRGGGQLVSGYKPDMATVEPDPRPRGPRPERSLLPQDSGGRSFHTSILIPRQRGGE